MAFSGKMWLIILKLKKIFLRGGGVLEGSLMGRNLPGGNVPGGDFPRTISFIANNFYITKMF